MTRILGIETSCDETAVALVDDGRRVLVNLVSSQVALHAPYGGIVPEVASRRHLELLHPLVVQALHQAQTTPDQIDAVAVTRGPGLVGALQVGLAHAKALAWAWEKPLLAMNHLEGHVYAPWMNLEDGESASFPHVSLLVSGGHTCLYRVEAWGRYTLLGRTRDDAVGEAYDKAAKYLGLGYPGGPIMDRLAREADTEAFTLPRPMLHDAGLDFSFSGLKTALIAAVTQARQAGRLPDDGAVAKAFQEAAVDVLVDKAVRAARENGCTVVTVTGGVAANSRLRERMREALGRHGMTYRDAPGALCTDNAAMIAGAAYHHSYRKQFSDFRVGAVARLPLEGVD